MRRAGMERIGKIKEKRKTRKNMKSYIVFIRVLVLMMLTGFLIAYIGLGYSWQISGLLAISAGLIFVGLSCGEEI